MHLAAQGAVTDPRQKGYLRCAASDLYHQSDVVVAMCVVGSHEVEILQMPRQPVNA